METCARGYSKLLSGLILATALIATGCSDGGKKGSPTSDSSSSSSSSSSGVTVDTTPEAFSFATKADVPVATAVSSEPATITGIDASAPVGIAGGSYSIDGGAFTAEGGSITEGQTIAVQVQSPDAFSASRTATLDVGGVTAEFTVTTEAQDTSPEAFTFTDQTAVDYSTAIASMPVTISGINDAVPVTITGGEYQIGAGEFTSEAGSITNDQTITVRVTSSAKAEQTSSATLTVGDQTAELNVTTKPDTVNPEVAIQFPPPASMTEGDTIYIRGESSDLHGSVANVTINGEMVTTEDDYATWSIELPLAEGENTLTVTATDMAGNVNDGEAVSVRRAPITSAFPNDDVVFQDPIDASITFVNQEPIAFVTDASAGAIIQVDLTTGQRSVLSSNADYPDVQLMLAWGIAYGSDGTLYVTDVDGSSIVGINSNTGNRTTVSDGSLLRAPYGLAHHEHDAIEMLYVADGNSIYSVDSVTGTEALVYNFADGVPGYSGGEISTLYGLEVDESSNRLFVTETSSSMNLLVLDLVSREPKFVASSSDIGTWSDLAVDAPRNRALVADLFNSGRVLVVDLESGGQRVLSDALTPDSHNGFMEPWGLAAHSGLEYFIIIDRLLNGLVAVDSDSGHRVVVSKSESP